MKKTSLLVSAVSLLICTTTVTASSYNNYISKINKTTVSLNVGLSSGSINDNSGTGAFIGYGFDNTNKKAYTTNKLYMGGDFFLGMNSINDNNVVNFSGDLKLGMNVIPKISIYGIGTVLIQDTNSFSASGFGMGLGTEWRINEKFAAVVDYKSYSLSSNEEGSTSNADYDYDRTSLYLKYRF